MAMVASVDVCACSGAAYAARHSHQERLNLLSLPPASWPGPCSKGGKRSRYSSPVVAVLPLLSLAAEASQQEVVETFYNDWVLDEMSLKNIYLCFSLFFVWGCCVFGSMKDPFYDSDLYRGDGGDGSGNWLYQLEEEEEVKAREELWREELAREIEERVGELRESEEAEKEKEKELA